MKRIISLSCLLLAGCANTQNEQASSSHNSYPNNQQPIDATHVQELDIANVRLADGSKVSLEEFRKLNESGGTIALKFNVDESGNTNAVATVVK